MPYNKRLAGLLPVIIATISAFPGCVKPTREPVTLLPYPQELAVTGKLRKIGRPDIELSGDRGLLRTARESVKAYAHPEAGDPMVVRIGSIEDPQAQSWLSSADRDFLAASGRSSEAYVLTVPSTGPLIIVGKTDRGALYGCQTLNQLLTSREHPGAIPCCAIHDWPDMSWRCLAPTMTWYSGYNRLEGYDLCNWTLDEWKWLADWSLLHKCNAWAICMYGYWPFSLPGHESNCLDVDSFFFNPLTQRKEPWRFTHRNIAKEFLPELIRYANQRGIQVYAYIGKNSFNGTYWLKRPEMNGGGAAELLPFAPGVHEYWDACIARILDIGFNGFVFEDPEAFHVPNQNEQCYKTFWEPWAKTYGYSSIKETDQNKPPLGVHVEYYTWLFRQFDEMIRRHIAEKRDRFVFPERENEPVPFSKDEPVPVYLISHFLLARVMRESKSDEERARWMAMIDEKHGRKVPFIVTESDEAKYTKLLGGDRVASLGGRGGSCTCAMRRIASVNNDWTGGPMAASVEYERDCQRHILEAGGFGAMGYIFEWTNTEVFGYIAAQHLWRNTGVPFINNQDEFGFLTHAYQRHYGQQVGDLVARSLDEAPCVNDAMVLEGVYGSQFPETGRPLHRDFQYLAVLADRAVELANRAYRLYTGRDADPYTAVYRQDDYHWNGYDEAADKLFKTERLRLLCVSQQRSRLMCEAALAHRKAERLMAEGAAVGAVLESLDAAIAAAKASQLLYQVNYFDDYDFTDGLCARVTDALEALRTRLVAECVGPARVMRSWSFERPGDSLGWTAGMDLTSPVVADGVLLTRATGKDPILTQTETLAIPVGKQVGLDIEMAADAAGTLQVFWTTQDGEAGPAGFNEAASVRTAVRASDERTHCRLWPTWNGKLTHLRIDPPSAATVRIASIRIIEVPEVRGEAVIDRTRAVPEWVRQWPADPLFIRWEKLSDQVPEQAHARKAGLYLSTDIGLDTRSDRSRLGVVFTVQARQADPAEPTGSAAASGQWKTIFRRSVGRRSTTWEHWDIPLDNPPAGANPRIELRLITDSYSRAQDRSAPTWKWALWGRPQVVRVASDGTRRTLYDCIGHLERARSFVCMDADGRIRPFDASGEDSTGATFQAVSADPLGLLRTGEEQVQQWVGGFARWSATPPHAGDYRCYLGTVDSGWTYGGESGEVTWVTQDIPKKQDTAIVFIGGTDYTAGQAELLCDGRLLLAFRTGSTSDARWEKDGVELRYLHGGDTRHGGVTHGLSGIYILKLPARLVTAGHALKLALRMKPGGGWVMVHGYRDPFMAIRPAAPPEPTMPAIAAFTPHMAGKQGVTIGEFDVTLGE